MIIYGWKDKVIKIYEDSHIKCSECGGYSHIFTVLQSYFHIFWIPFFPLSRKKVVCQCRKCNDTSNTERQDHYRSITGTPFYLFTGTAIVISFILYSLAGNFRENGNIKKYVNDPQVGDVFMLSTDEYENKITYEFYKIVEVTPDSLFLITNAHYYYKKNIDEIDPDDYFISNDLFVMHRKLLEEYRQHGMVKKVFRNYPATSTFHYEDEVEFYEDEEIDEDIMISEVGYE